MNKTDSTHALEAQQCIQNPANTDRTFISDDASTTGQTFLGVSNTRSYGLLQWQVIWVTVTVSQSLVTQVEWLTISLTMSLRLVEVGWDWLRSVEVGWGWLLKSQKLRLATSANRKEGHARIHPESSQRRSNFHISRCIHCRSTFFVVLVTLGAMDCSSHRLCESQRLCHSH